MKDWNVDGHYIAATDESEALDWAGMLYSYNPERIRPWTPEDQAKLDETN